MGTGNMLCLLSVPGVRWSNVMVTYGVDPNLYSISNDWLKIDAYEPPGQLPINNYGFFILFQFHQNYQRPFITLSIQISLIGNLILYRLLLIDSIGVPAVYRLVWYCIYTICGMMKIKLIGSGGMKLIVMNGIKFTYLEECNVSNFWNWKFNIVCCVFLFFVLFFVCFNLFVFNFFIFLFLIFIFIFFFFLFLSEFIISHFYHFLNFGYVNNFILKSGVF